MQDPVQHLHQDLLGKMPKGGTLINTARLEAMVSVCTMDSGQRMDLTSPPC